MYTVTFACKDAKQAGAMIAAGEKVYEKTGGAPTGGSAPKEADDDITSLMGGEEADPEITLEMLQAKVQEVCKAKTGNKDKVAKLLADNSWAGIGKVPKKEYKKFLDGLAKI